MATSVWSGHLTFGLMSIPVSLYAAARSTGISFNQLHRTDHQRVKQQLVCSGDGQKLDRADIVKGFEFRKNEYVVIEPDEIKNIQPKSSKILEILEFVPANDVDPVYFESSYHVAPATGGMKPFVLVSAALREAGVNGVAKLFMHNREYTVIIRPYEDKLMLHTMYYRDEVRDSVAVVNEGPDQKQVKVAIQYIKALENKWEPEKYNDGFQESLKQLIEAKLEGGTLPKTPETKAPTVVQDIMAALQQSLAKIMGTEKKAS